MGSQLGLVLTICRARHAHRPISLLITGYSLLVFAAARFSSCSRMAGPSCETFPAPRVKIMSPGCAMLAAEAAASGKLLTYFTSRPLLDMRCAKACAVMPGIGASLAG